jgi:hypothetical protein
MAKHFAFLWAACDEPPHLSSELSDHYQTLRGSIPGFGASFGVSLDPSRGSEATMTSDGVSDLGRFCGESAFPIRTDEKREIGNGNEWATEEDWEAGIGN